MTKQSTRPSSASNDVESSDQTIPEQTCRCCPDSKPGRRRVSPWLTLSSSLFFEQLVSGSFQRLQVKEFYCRVCISVSIDYEVIICLAERFTLFGLQGRVEHTVFICTCEHQQTQAFLVMLAPGSLLIRGLGHWNVEYME